MHVCTYVGRYICIRGEIGSGHPGKPGHVLSGASKTDPLYKMSYPDSALDHVF